MEYVEWEPPADLVPYVTRLWHLEASAARRYERIFPQPAIHVIVNLAEPYTLFDRDAGTERSFPAGFVSGLQPRYLMIQSPSRIRHVTAELTPFGAGRFLAVSPTELTGTVRDTEGLLGGAGQASDAPAGTDALRLAALDATPERCRDLLVELLRRSVRSGFVSRPPLERAWREILADPDRPIAEIAAAVGLSHHALIDGFRSYCGLTPKAYADIVRFQQFVTSLPLDGPMPSWSTLVAASGYYDQPHFIRVFRAFTGLSPSRYVQLVAEFGAEYAAFVPLDSLDGS